MRKGMKAGKSFPTPHLTDEQRKRLEELKALNVAHQQGKGREMTTAEVVEMMRLLQTNLR